MITPHMRPVRNCYIFVLNVSDDHAHVKFRGFPQRSHPLEALDQMLGLMQGMSLELLKCYAPVLMEEAQLRSAAFLGTGKVAESKRGGHHMLSGLLRLQEAVAKLGVGQTKVKDELRRRAKSA